MIMPGTTLNAQDMTPLEYLDQTDVWYDVRSGSFQPIECMTEARRGYATRWLKRNAVAFILLAEHELTRDRNLAAALSLVDQNPQDWMRSTKLYGAIDRDERIPRQDEQALTRSLRNGMGSYTRSD